MSREQEEEETKWAWPIKYNNCVCGRVFHTGLWWRVEAPNCPVDHEAVGDFVPQKNPDQGLLTTGDSGVSYTYGKHITLTWAGNTKKGSVTSCIKKEQGGRTRWFPLDKLLEEMAKEEVPPDKGISWHFGPTSHTYVKWSELRGFLQHLMGEINESIAAFYTEQGKGAGT